MEKIDEAVNEKIMDHLIAKHIPLADTFVQSGVVYGAIPLRSLFVLNGGALFLFPAILASFDKLNIEPEALIGVGGYFLLGIIFAAASCLFAYLNFNINAQHSFLRLDYEYIQKTADTASLEYAEQFDQIKATHRKIMRHGRWVAITQYISVMTGVSGYVAFAYGCYLSANLFAGI